jgi:predicted transcriptional regulator
MSDNKDIERMRHIADNLGLHPQISNALNEVADNLEMQTTVQIADEILALKNSGSTQKEIANDFEMSEPEVSTYLTLARGNEKIKKAVGKGDISLSAVEPLLTKSLAVQAQLVDAALRQRTVRGVRAVVKTHEMKTDVTAPDSQLEEDIDPTEFLALEAVKHVVGLLETGLLLPIESVTIRRAMLPIVQEIEEKAKELSDTLMGDDLPF